MGSTWVHDPGEDNPTSQLLGVYGLEVKTCDYDNEQVWSVDSIEYTTDQIDYAWDAFLHVCFICDVLLSACVMVLKKTTSKFSFNIFSHYELSRIITLVINNIGKVILVIISKTASTPFPNLSCLLISILNMYLLL